METGNSTAGNRYKHVRPYGKSVRVSVFERHLRNVIAADDNPADDRRRHDDERNTEHRIHAPDDLIDGQKGC